MGAFELTILKGVWYLRPVCTWAECPGTSDRLARPPVSPPCRRTGGGIGAVPKRHSPWP